MENEQIVEDEIVYEDGASCEEIVSVSYYALGANKLCKCNKWFYSF
jgi:hypothetical protein